jgi:hypothetical protein
MKRTNWYAQYDIEHRGDMFSTLRTNGSNGLPHVFGIRLSHRWDNQAAGGNEDSIV